MPNNLRRSKRVVRRCAFYVVAVIVVAVALMTSHAAVAQSCTAAGPALTLGTVNPYAGTSTTTSGNGSYNCVNPTAAAVTGYACVSVGTGSGGTSATNRTLASGTSKLPISITAGGASGQVGNGTSYPMQGPIVITIAANGSKAGTFPLAVTLPPPASGPPPGSYTSSFATTDAQFIYYTGSATTTCATLNAGTYLTTQANFSVSATIAVNQLGNGTRVQRPIGTRLC